MKKDLKEKLVRHGRSLYNAEWVEKTATEGFERTMAGLREKEPQFAAVMEKCLWPFEIMYYSAFEDALNTFLLQCIEDGFTEVQLYLDELHKLNATITTKSKKDGKKG